MNCLSCFQCQRSIKEEGSTYTEYDHRKQEAASDAKPKRDQTDHTNITSQQFTFRELATATRNFRQECLLGEGGFGRVYKGTLSGSGQVVAVKQLDRHGLQGNKEFLVEVLMLSQLHHENLVKLVGYCADGEQRLLVYEYLSGGSLEDHLFDIEAEKKPFDWVTRMRIAFGAAQGLEYLHDKADPPVIYRDLKCSNILLDSDYNPKLSDFGLAKLGPANDKNNNVSSRVMGTYGYCAPEYARTGQLTVKSDVYSFGVVLLELITGRRAIDHTRPLQERNLVTWAQPKFRDPKSFPDMADPLLEHRFPEKGLNQVVAIAAMCLQEEASVRPLMSDVVATLGFLLEAPPEPMAAPVPESLPSAEKIGKAKSHLDQGDKSDTESRSSGGSDTDRKGSHSKNDRTDVAQDEEGKHNSSDDEEDDNFPTLLSEDKEYDSSDSSSTISFSLGGSILSRDKSNKSHGRSISSNRQVSLEFSEKSISSRESIGRELSRKSNQRSKHENDLLSPRGRVSSSSHRSSNSSHDEIDLITPKGSIASSSHKNSKKSPFGSSTVSSKDKNVGVLSRKSRAKSRDGNDSDDSSSPRSSIGSTSHKGSMRSRDESRSMHEEEEHGDHFGENSLEGS